MRIATARVHGVSVPMQCPIVIAGTRERVMEIPCLLLHLTTTDGIPGLGFAFSMSPAMYRSLRAALEDLSALVVGEDPLRPERVATKLREAGEWVGPGGVLAMAAAAVDVALWDIAGKVYGQPLCKLLGGTRERVPTYASGVLRREWSLQQMEETTRRLVEQGFRAMKMRLGGGPTMAAEEERIRVVRAAAGSDVQIMVDANQSWRPPQAIQIGRMLERYQIAWLEDPVDHRDISGLGQVAAALDMPVCAGEYLYGLEPFRYLVETRAVDVVMIDLLRVGGVTPWRKVAALAEVFGLPVVSHMLPEIQCHLVAAVPNGMTVEHMPWFHALWREIPPMQDGQITVPVKPGHGLEADEAFVQAHALA